MCRESDPQLSLHDPPLMPTGLPVEGVSEASGWAQRAIHLAGLPGRSLSFVHLWSPDSPHVLNCDPAVGRLQVLQIEHQMVSSFQVVRGRPENWGRRLDGISVPSHCPTPRVSQARVRLTREIPLKTVCRLPSAQCPVRFPCLSNQAGDPKPGVRSTRGSSRHRPPPVFNGT